MRSVSDFCLMSLHVMRCYKIRQTLALLVWSCCTSAFASDFSGPLQDVQVFLNGNTVSYQVFDPGRNLFVPVSETMPPGYVSTPSANGGVVAWLAGSTVYYRIYDPSRSNWIGGTTVVTGGPILDPISDSGVVAWLGGGAVYFAVYDPIGRTWKANGL